MAFVVTLRDITPPARGDGIPWNQALVSEAASSTGPWTQIQVIGPFVDLDTDPAHPKARTITTTLATAASGLFYSIVFKDAFNNTSQRSRAVLNADEVNWRPTVQEVAVLVRARTVDKNGNEVGTFNNNTTPSAGQVDELIDQAVEDLYPIFKSTVIDAPVPPNASIEAYREAVAALAATRTALLVEITHFGKEVASGNSPYKLMWADYRQQLLQVATMLGIVVPGLTPTTPGGASIIEGSHIAIWGNEDSNNNIITRPL